MTLVPFSLVLASTLLAQNPSPPVQLNSCALMYDNTSSLSASVTGLEAKFTNNSSKVAHVVNIRADVNGTIEVIRDEGTFSPGIEIDHRYRAGRGQFALPMILESLFGKPSVRCTIDSVQFVDGTRWSASAAPPSSGASSPAITVFPANLAMTGRGKSNAHLVMASGGGSLSLNSNCGGVADVQLLATTSTELALRVTPLASGSCTITVRDVNDNMATIPVTVSP